MTRAGSSLILDWLQLPAHQTKREMKEFQNFTVPPKPKEGWSKKQWKLIKAQHKVAFTKDYGPGAFQKAFGQSLKWEK